MEHKKAHFQFGSLERLDKEKVYNTSNEDNFTKHQYPTIFNSYGRKGIFNPGVKDHIDLASGDSKHRYKSSYKDFIKKY